MTDSISSGILETPNGVLVSDTCFSDIKLVSGGAYCCFYRARRQGQWWGLKCLKEEYKANPFYESLLKKEYNLLCKLNHSVIVRTQGMEHVEELGMCIVQEYVEGKTLDKTKGTRADRRRWFKELLEAVGYIHSLQIVHRDLKPQNVLVADNGQHIRLIDFGLADADNFIELKQTAGTLHYMSPEQQRGGAPDARNDVYSLGVMMRELQMGLVYNLVAARCTGKIERRYKSAQAILEAIQRVKRIFATVATLILTAGILLCWLLLPQSASVQSQVQTEKDTIFISTTNDHPSVSDDSKVGLSPETIQGARTLKADDFFTEACGKIDAFMKDHQYEKLIESAKSQDMTDEYTKLMYALWQQVSDVRDGYSDKLSPVEKSALYKALVDYAQDKYAAPLYKAVSEYEKSEQ